MSDQNLRNLSNNFQEVRLVSLASWAAAKEISPCDRGGPYMVTQEGYDPEDLKLIPDEFALGRSGKWLSLGHFFRMPVAERRAEFVFGTAGEVMQMMSALPPKAVVLRPGDETEPAAPNPEQDAMAAAYQAGKAQSSRTPT